MDTGEEVREKPVRLEVEEFVGSSLGF